MEKKVELYRPNVAAIVINEQSKILIAKRNDLKDVWQFPQGGIDKGEEPQIAVLRELEEEIGVNSSALEILCEMPKWLSYDFPPKAKKRLKPYSGQIQRYFLVRLKDEKLININTQKPEFEEYKFLDLSEIWDYFNELKKPVYTEAINYFKEKGFLC